MGRIVGVGAIFGIVSEDGVAKVASPVNLYDRTTGKLVSRQLTRPDGGFVFNGLNENSSDYLLTATDEDGTTPKNALSQDRVQPVPGYSGATFWGNWANLSRTLGAVGGYAGALDGAGSGQPFDCGTLYTNASPPVFGQPSITPGAPNISSFDMSGSAVAFPAQTVASVTQGWGFPAKISFEVAFDPTTCTGNEVWMGAVFEADNSGVDSGSYVYSNPAFFLYSPSTKTVTLYRWNSGNDPYRFSGAIIAAGAVDLSAATGPVHLIGTVAYGYQAKVYLDGVLQTTTDLSGTQSTFYGADRAAAGGEFKGVYVTANGNNGPLGPNGTTGRIGAMAAYQNKILSDTEVTALYQALMVGTTPNISGYPKEVVLDLPAYYFRFNDADVSISAQEFLSGDTGNSAGTEAATTYNAPGLTPQAPSIVTGGNAVTFNGGGFRAQYAGWCTSDRRALTYSFMINPAGTPAADEYIMAERRWDELDGHSIRRTVSNTLTATFRENGVLVSYPFTTALAVGVMQHVVIRLDKYAGTLDLWLGDTSGITKVETLTPSTTLLDADDLTFRNRQRSACFGGKINAAVTSGANMLHADLAEFAYFPRALFDDRILAQNAALTTV